MSIYETAHFISNITSHYRSYELLGFQSVSSLILLKIFKSKIHYNSIG